MNPVFKPFELKVEKICNEDYLRPINVDVFDYEESGNHKHVGQTTFTLQDIVKQNKKNFQFKSKGSNKPAGELIFDQVSIIIKPEFIDYLRG